MEVVDTPQTTVGQARLWPAVDFALATTKTARGQGSKI